MPDRSRWSESRPIVNFTRRFRTKNAANRAHAAWTAVCRSARQASRSFLGCIFGLIHKAKTGDSRFAFGPYLSAGMALALVVGEPIANLYLQLCGLR